MGGVAAARAVAAVTRMTSDVCDASEAAAPANSEAEPEQSSAPASGQGRLEVHACESEDTDVMMLLGLEMLNPGGQELAASADLAEQQQQQQQQLPPPSQQQDHQQQQQQPQQPGHIVGPQTRGSAAAQQ